MDADKVKAALKQLDVANDNHWTEDGLPRVEAMRLLAGDASLTREQITLADASFTRASATAAVDVPAPPVESLMQAPPAEVTKEDVVTESLTLDQKLEKAQAELDDAEGVYLAAYGAYKASRDKVDQLMVEMDRLLEPEHKRTMNSILDYQHAQHAAMKDRGERWAKFRATGLKIEDVLPMRAPIDQVRVRRK